jgi:hypothetical protein
MPLNWRVWRPFLVALLLTVSGILPQTVAAQVSGPDFNEDLGFDSGSQALPESHWDISLNRYQIREINGSLAYQLSLEGSPIVDAPGFDGIDSGGLEDFCLQLFNLGEHLVQTDDSSMQVLAPLPTASAPSQGSRELLGDSRSPVVPDAVSPLPDPPQPSDLGWHVSISPYLWLPGLHGTIGARGHDASVHASFSDIFSNFSFALMGALEPCYNRIVMPLDFMWIKLSNDKALPFDVGATSVKVKVNLDVLSQKIGYRVIDVEKFKVDAVAGFRYWHVGTTVDLVSSILTNKNFYGSADWVDAVGGARIQAVLSPKLVLTIAGDAGGGGANSDYQVAGLIGWKFRKFTLQTGYRYLTVNYRPSGGTICDVAISGLVLGVTIPLK